MSQDDQREWEMESGVDKPRNNRGTLSLSGKVEHKIFPSALKRDGDLGWDISSVSLHGMN